MKKLTQQEFEELIRQIIDGKRSETSVIKELKTESRTFNNKIQELSLNNPELYYEFIRVRPYKPKERKDINIRGFAIEVLKTGITVEEMCSKYNIGRRTISRKILQLKNSEKKEDIKLYELYKRIADKKSRSQELSYEDIFEINALEAEDVIGMNNVERRRQELLKLEKEYQDLSMQVGKEEAARRLGYTQNRIYKLLNELYRIEIERNGAKRTNQPINQGNDEKDSRNGVKEAEVKKQEGAMSEAKKYRDRMRVEGVNVAKAVQASVEGKSEEKHQDSNGKESKKKIKTEQEGR